jgi:plasmid stability protein
MKNITVSVDEEVYHRARIRAAELRTSVSALVGHFLKQAASTETENERLRRIEQETVERIQARQRGFSAGNRLKRDDLYDRHALR